MFIPIKANYGCEFCLTLLSNTIQIITIISMSMMRLMMIIPQDWVLRWGPQDRQGWHAQGWPARLTIGKENYSFRFLVLGPIPWQSWRFFVFVSVFVFVFVFWSVIMVTSQYLFNHLIHGEAGGSSLSGSQSTLTCFCVPGTWHLSVNLNLLLCTWHQLLACSHCSQRLFPLTTIFAWKTIYAVPGEETAGSDSPCELLLLAFELKSQNADQALPASFYVGRCQLAARPRRVRNTF